MNSSSLLEFSEHIRLYSEIVHSESSSPEMILYNIKLII
jgi:hypothetical protein